MVKTPPVVTHHCDMEFRSGSSDKVYHIWIENVGANHTVKFRYGRRGSTLNNGTKIGPTHARAAQDAYMKVISEKLGKGYKDVTAKVIKKTMSPPEPFKGAIRTDDDLVTVSGSTVTSTMPKTTIKSSVTLGSTASPQLLNPIKESELDAYMKNDQFVFQQKHDGRRMLLMHSDRGDFGWNRKGVVIDAPEEYCSTLQKFGAYHFILDGEACGDKYYAFDILMLQGMDQKALPYEERLQNLGMLLRSVDQDVIQMVYTAESWKAKDSLMKSIREGNKEGVVIKDKTSPYTSGRPNSGGPALKFKLVESVSCVVTKINEKRSVMLALGHNPSARTALIHVGSVTIPPNHKVPAVKDIVEVEYLYAYEGGSLYQPVYKGKRDDVPVDTVQDLKFKPKEK